MRPHGAVRAPRALLTDHRHPAPPEERPPWEEPAEEWAGPESLDPTPVWKQYVVLAVLSVVLLVALGAYCAATVTQPPPQALPRTSTAIL